MRFFPTSLCSSILLFGLSASSLLAESTLTVSELEKTSATEGSLLLTLKTTEHEATAFETEFVYDPARVDVTAPGSLQVPGTADGEFTVDSFKVSDGHVRVVLSSSRLKPLADGTTFRVPVRAAKGVSEIDTFFPVALTDMELSDVSAKAARPKVGTSLRIKRLQSGDKLNGKSGVSLGLELMKDDNAQVENIEYLANGKVVKNSTGVGDLSWSPPGSGVFQLSARVTLKDGSKVESRATSVVVTGLGTTPVRGAYTGVVQDSSGKKEASATGTVQIATSTSGTAGSYSVRIVLNGTSLSAAGKFNSESIATPSVVSRAGGVPKTYRLYFQQEATGFADSITGVVTDGTLSAAGVASGGSLTSKFVATRNIWASTPSGTGTMAGKYTLALPLSGDGSDAPLGISLLTVAASGTAVGRFTLTDGTRAVATGTVAKDGLWQPYASLYAKKGFLVGELDVLGGRFVAPARGTLLTVKSGTANLSVSISGGSLSSDIKQSATLTASNLIQVPIPNVKRLVLRLDRTGGGLSGSFVAPGDTKTTPVAGVILQGENRAIGSFVRNGVRGFVEITAAP